MTDRADLAQALRLRAKAAATAADVWTWEDERLVDLALGALESALARATKALDGYEQLKQDAALVQAALDRLAALTEEDVLDEIEDSYTERERARAVLALVRARVEGRGRGGRARDADRR